MVFDFALRPVFYWVNSLAVSYLGLSTYSLLLLSVLVYGLSVALCFASGKNIAGASGGLFASAAFITSTVSLNVGIRAMPHLFAGAIAAASVYLFTVAWHTQNQRQRRTLAIAASIVSVCALGSHPTMLGYIFALGIVYTGLLWLQWRKVNIRCSFDSKTCLWAIFAMALTFEILSVLYSYFHGLSYIAQFLEGMDKVQGNKFVRYRGEWWYYLMFLVRDLFPILIMLATVGIYAAVSLRRGKKDVVRSATSGSHGVLLAIVWCFAFLLVGVSSFAQWKFGRVFAGFTPIVSIAFGSLVGWLWGFVRGAKIRRAMIMVLLSIFGICLWQAPIAKIDYHRHRRASLFHKYQGLVSAVRLSKKRNVLVVGNKKWKRQVIIAGKRPIQFSKEPSDIMEKRARFIELLQRKKIEFVLLEVSGQGQEPLLDEIRVYFREQLSGHKVYHWRGLSEVWHLPTKSVEK